MFYIYVLYIELVDISLNLKSQLSFSQYFMLIVRYFPVTMMISEIVLLITWSSWRMAPYKQQPLAIQSSSKEGLTQSRLTPTCFTLEITKGSTIIISISMIRMRSFLVLRWSVQFSFDLRGSSRIENILHSRNDSPKEI